MASGYYDITSKTLGKGHYGVVKLGRHCLTGEPVAIKIIEKARLNSDSLNQLGTEIRILFRLSEYEHPNILKLYQTIDTEDKLYLVTEYCGPHACDLHDYISRKHCRDGLAGREAQIFFMQICSAISYCHSMGIVHRDLKPENILVTDYKHLNSEFLNRTQSVSENNEHIDNNNINHQMHLYQYPLLKLIDFGFANQWYPDEKMRTSCGTLAYSAPELLLGEAYDGTKVDVWGLGLMLYILLYGGNPFMQINDNETLTRILDCSFATPKRDNVDIDAIELLRSLIKRNPDTRLPMDAILRHKWFSDVPNAFETLLKYPVKNDTAPSLPATPVQTSKQLPQLSKLTSTQNVSSTLPSISEIGPLKNLNKSLDDSANIDYSEQTPYKPNNSRTRSLSITRSYNNSTQQQQQQQQQTKSLTHTRSSLNLEKINSSHQPTPSRGSSMYRPTSPDVGGSLVAPTKEESQLHDCVIQEMFRLTKLIDSKSSIEASLKNARFTHRQFNQNSIQPTIMCKRELSMSIGRLLGVKKVESPNSSTRSIASDKKSVNDISSKVDKLGSINTKLSNDDYIYATYQLTRDRMLRVRKERLKARTVDNENGTSPMSNRVVFEPKSSSKVVEDVTTRKEDTAQKSQNMDRASAKENDGSRKNQARKLLQPQHKMRDKFTSFFRSESTSPNGSFSFSCDLQTGGDNSLKDHLNHSDTHHEAFSEHNNEYSASGGARYKNETNENSLAFALPLARKCSLVSEESGCSNDLPDN